MTAPAAPAPPTPLSALPGRVRAFFFAEEVPYGVAAARIALPLPLLYDACLRWPHARELYSADGAPAALWHTYGFPNALPELPGWAAVGLYSLYVLALVCTLLGWKSRTNAAVAAAGLFYFCSLDAIGSLNKYTAIGTHLLTLLALSRCGEVWSLDAIFRRRTDPAAAPRRFPAWPRRLMQLHIGLVYFGAAFTKLHMADFFTGDQMVYWMATHVNRFHPLSGVMIEHPWLLQIGAYATCVWELTFLFLAWSGWGRRVMLALGVKFHLMTTLTLGLFLFPQVCWAAYWAYLNERDVAAFGARFAKLRAALPKVSLPVPAAVGRWGYLAVAPVVMVCGMGAEHALDPYEAAGGKPALREVDIATVRAMTAPHRPARPGDLLWSFDVGTDLLGGTVVGRDRAFDVTETLTAQAWLAPPHGDVLLTCGLAHDAGGEPGTVIDARRGLLTRDAARYAFAWPLDGSVPAGDYWMTLSIDGAPVAAKPLTLTAD